MRINKSALSLRYNSDFCGENEGNPEWGEIDFVYYLRVYTEQTDK